MKKFKKYLIFIIILITTNIYSEDIEKIIFSINNNSYTTIDLEQRIIYLNLLTNENIQLSNKEIKDDFISVLLFDEFSKKNNILVKNKILNDYFKTITNNYKLKNPKKFDKLISSLTNYKEIINKNIKYDYQRKLVIENSLNEKNLENYKKNEDEILNINDIKVEYFSFDKKNNFQLSDVKKFINYNKIDETKIILNEKNISFTFNSSLINSLKNIDKRIKQKILNNENEFIIEENQYFLIGKIYKRLKNDINLKYTFYQINSENKNSFENLKNLHCDDINLLKNNINYEIKEFSNIEINKLNKIITDNLKLVNDKILLDNNNTKSYIILCKLEYNKDITKQKIINQKINKVIQEIEFELINKMKENYNFKNYE